MYLNLMSDVKEVWGSHGAEEASIEKEPTGMMATVTH